jgi:FkbM family methyltransferase
MRHSILHTAANAAWVAKNDRRAAVPLLVTYSRLKAQERLSALRGRDGIKRTKILDMVVSFFDYDWLVEMFEEIFLRKQYYFESQNRQPVVLDVGSNIGLAILFFKRLHPDAKVIAFEPDPEAFDVLTRNIAENGLDNVRALNEAVYSGSDWVYLYGDPNTPGSPQKSTRSERMAGARSAVRATTLSRHLTEPVDFLKVDVEGAERIVIGELERLGKLNLIARMAVEYHHHLDPNEDALSEILSLLERNGFGYQLEARLDGAAGSRTRHYQNVLVHAYRKEPLAVASPRER